MTHFSMTRKHDQAQIVTQGVVADDFWLRLKGLIGKKTFMNGEGLYFPKCNDIHMWMMSVAIDVVFLKSGTIIEAHENIKPWRLLPLACFKAQDTLELPSGTISKFNLKPGEVLCFAS